MFYTEVYIHIQYIFTCILSQSYNDLASWHPDSKASHKKPKKIHQTSIPKKTFKTHSRRSLDWVKELKEHLGFIWFQLQAP